MLPQLVFTFLVVSFSIFGKLPPSKTTQQTQKEELLVIFHAKDGRLSALPNENKYLLTLYQVDQNVTYFTDPPRKGGKMAVKNFLKVWRLTKRSSKEKIQNGSILSVVDFRNKERFSDLPLQLSSPQYDPNNQRLSFIVEVIGELKLEPQDLGETTLFIEEVSSSVLGVYSRSQKK